MKILKNKKIYLSISGLLVFLSIISVLWFGFNLSVDFKGGTVYEIQYKNSIPTLDQITKSLKKENVKNVTIQKKGGDFFVIKTPDFSEEIKKNINRGLNLDGKYSFEEKRVKSIGPSISSELENKSIFAIIFVSIIIILFIAYVFRKVAKPVSSFKYGLVAVIALIHDIIIPIGVFALLGHFFVDYQIDVLFVTALLAILGYSVNDTIVIFDRIRENLNREKNPDNIQGKKFEKIVGESLNQTIVRSLNTSITTFIVIILLYIFGGETTKPFALVLSIGVLVGTYSSIFLASPLLILIEQKQKKK